MKPGMAESPLRQTIFEVFAPVERHQAARKARDPEAAKVATPLTALDAYLMQLLAVMRDDEAVVLDLAGEATGGASTVLWGTQGWGGRLVAPATTAGVPGDFEVETFDAGPEGLGLANLPARCRDVHRPLVICLALGSAGGAEAIERLAAIYAANPRAVVLAFPLGLVGRDPGLGAILGWAEGAGLGLAAVRDLTPSLAVARLGVLYPADDAAVPAVLGRIRRFFEGNFDVLKLAALYFKLTTENDRLVADLKGSNDRATEIERWAHSVEAQHKALDAEYHKLVAWCRHLEGRDQEREAAAAHQAAAPAPMAEVAARPVEFVAARGGDGSLRRLRHRLFPPHSLQERAGRTIQRLHRKLRGPHQAHAARQASEGR